MLHFAWNGEHGQEQVGAAFSGGVVGRKIRPIQARKAVDQSG